MADSVRNAQQQRARAHVPLGASILQAWLDHAAPATRIKVVLSGSHVSAMRQLEGTDQPFYGRRTHRLVLGPFGVSEVGAFVPAYSAEERLMTFAAFGGLPGHLSLLDPARTLADNAAALLLNAGGRLVDEAQHMLDSFLADAVVHYSIIEAIAGGDHTWKGITNRTGRTGGSLQRAVDWLVDMEVIERVVPISEKSPQRSKRALYRITDPYVAFWHRFVSPLVAVGSVGLVEPRRLWDTTIVPRFDDYMGGVFERICRDAVRRSASAPVRARSRRGMVGRVVAGTGRRRGRRQ